MALEDRRTKRAKPSASKGQKEDIEEQGAPIRKKDLIVAVVSEGHFALEGKLAES